MVRAALPTAARMYRAVLTRDTTFEGVFWVGVKTTGIVCRPACPAKKPARANVEFFGRLVDALAAGYRPCKRCKPLQPHEGVPDWMAPLLQAVVQEPGRRLNDASLRNLGLEPARVRRWFIKTHGLTFHAYQRTVRLGRALQHLRRGHSVTSTTYETGYESLTAFREAFSSLFGVLPRDANTTTPASLIGRRLTTPLGPMLAVAAPSGLCLLEFADRPMLATQTRRVRAHFGGPIVDGAHSCLDQIERELRLYFSGELQHFSTPLVTPATPFQEAAWDQLKQIPYGQTMSYDEQARRMGKPGAQRAVGHANGHNRIAIVIPCHRVIRSDGKLCGYGGGLWRKRRLLELEANVLARSTPTASAASEADQVAMSTSERPVTKDPLGLF